MDDSYGKNELYQTVWKWTGSKAMTYDSFVPVLKKLLEWRMNQWMSQFAHEWLTLEAKPASIAIVNSVESSLWTHSHKTPETESLKWNMPLVLMGGIFGLEKQRKKAY